ncbi:Ribonuclease VapC10 [Phycisphaerales bacterium]|nr:Ribonuclease VapC10 [Phycisphaerales bacterium]
MTDLVIDTSLLVDALRGVEASEDFLVTARRSGRPVVHPVVEAELIVGARGRGELKQVLKLLARFESLAMEPIDARTSLRLLGRHRLGGGVSWEDCLLAATALRLSVPLATLNDKHFRVFRGLEVVRPY